MEFDIAEKERKIAVIITLAALVVLIAIITSLVFQFNIVQNLVMSWVLTTFYSICAFWIAGDPVAIRTIQVDRPVIQRVEVPFPVIQEVIREVEKPIEVIREIQVDRPVIQRVEVPVLRTIEKKVYMKRKKLNIPRFNFVASKETKRFHTRNCRLGKLIKNKYKIHNNSKAFFKRKHFKSCKACMKKK